MTAVTAQELIDAQEDAQTLEDLINGAVDLNGDGTLTTRLGALRRTIAKLYADIEEGVVDGVDGAPGETGAQGVQGIQGVQGVQGDIGPAGADGAGTGDMVASNNLSDVASASSARSNLGLAIGSDVQAHAAVLTSTTASFTSALKTKLDAVETGATADQTNAQIKTAYLANSDTNQLTDERLARIMQVRAWCSFDGNGAITIRDSYNIAGVVDTGTGQFTFTFTDDLPNTAFGFLSGSQGNSDARVLEESDLVSRSVSEIEVVTRYVHDTNDGFLDLLNSSFAILSTG